MELSSAETQLIFAAVTFLRDDANDALEDMELSDLERDNSLNQLHRCNRLLNKLKKFMDANQISSPL